MQIDRLIQGQMYVHGETGQVMMYQQTSLERGEVRYIFTLPQRSPNRYVYLSQSEVLKYIKRYESQVRK